ncbi:MepB family protein [Corynebacterium stationis]|uniref:MepB family protein n=1 Tax=Corynebacterium stationis TaxID=1705 RepID=UPI00242BB435|nr:MepB family protein [Corynebacterium stationis]
MKFRRFEDYAHEHGIDAEVLPEEQNSDYESGVATIEGAKWHIRTARNTPTKPGAFVAFWCRDKDGTTAPFKADEVISGLLVFVEQNGQRGVIRFTAEHLEALGITTGKHSGKRGFRVYPSWETNLNKQATATQRAQSPAFQEY